MPEITVSREQSRNIYSLGGRESLDSLASVWSRSCCAPVLARRKHYMARSTFTRTSRLQLICRAATFSLAVRLRWLLSDRR
jgi:hypothetical protein